MKRTHSTLPFSFPFPFLIELTFHKDIRRQTVSYVKDLKTVTQEAVREEGEKKYITMPVKFPVSTQTLYKEEGKEKQGEGNGGNGGRKRRKRRRKKEETKCRRGRKNICTSASNFGGKQEKGKRENV